MRRWLVVIGAMLGIATLLGGVLVARAYLFTPPETAVAGGFSLDRKPEGAVARLAEALRFPTISHADPDARDASAFLDLHEWMNASYPRFHATLSRQAFGLSLLYTWPGQDPSLAPVLFMAHQDVVPVDGGTEDDWAHPPFGGEIADGYVWGRGAIDMKSVLVALLEATETLLAQGYRPKRTLLFAFGHDEEVGGSGNQAIADALAGRGTRLAWVVDEGLTVTEGVVRGATTPVALIGIAEKGYLSLELVTETEGGHASMPPDRTAVGILARAIHRLEEAPFPASLDGSTVALLERLGPAMPFPQRLAFANLWLFDSFVEARLTKQPTTNALLRTTTAATLFEGGVKDNVLPQHARAVVNFRIHPRDSVASVTDRVKTVVDDPRVTIQPLRDTPHSEPSPVSGVSAPGFRAIEQAIRSTFPLARVAPSLFVAATDSRHYAGIAGDIYRFMPYHMYAQDLARIHGTDERISVTNFASYLQFYGQLLRGAGG